MNARHLNTQYPLSVVGLNPILISFLACLFGFLIAQPLSAAPATEAELKAGRQLADELSALRPSENASFQGILKIRNREGETRQLRFKSQVQSMTNHWTVTYWAEPAGEGSAELLTVLHAIGQPNQYEYSPKAGITNRLDGTKAMIPFAGSDFWLGDLALDFIHWPEQRVVKKEMRKGRSCRVLESKPASTPALGYSRVLSWIDLETDGVVMAEAYGPSGELLKEFEIKSFKKDSAGQWQLEEMEIRNVKTRSRTWMSFDVPRN